MIPDTAIVGVTVLKKLVMLGCVIKGFFDGIH